VRADDVLGAAKTPQLQMYQTDVSVLGNQSIRLQDSLLADERVRQAYSMLMDRDL
jgi:hypothetical protein